jgi:hypothetical protein
MVKLREPEAFLEWQLFRGGRPAALVAQVGHNFMRLGAGFEQRSPRGSTVTLRCAGFANVVRSKLVMATKPHSEESLCHISKNAP